MEYEIPVFLELKEVPEWLEDPRKFWGQRDFPSDDREGRAEQLKAAGGERSLSVAS